MTTRRVGLIALLLIGALVGGCATTRSEIKLSSPAAVRAEKTTTGRAVVIRSVTDERVFEQAPGEPSTPSLGFEGAQQASADIKARAVARKRGGFGKAMGDVLLENGQTVAGLVRENLTAAFQQAGYQIAGEGAVRPAPLVIDVHIRQFWAWFQPGFWAITLSANIETSLDVAGASSPTVIKVHSEESRQIATETAWLEILQKALLAYREQVVSKLSAPALLTMRRPTVPLARMTQSCARITSRIRPRRGALGWTARCCSMKP